MEFWLAWAKLALVARIALLVKTTRELALKAMQQERSPEATVVLRLVAENLAALAQLERRTCSRQPPAMPGRLAWR
jgi:hypothetical protein